MFALGAFFVIALIVHNWKHYWEVQKEKKEERFQDYLERRKEVHDLQSKLEAAEKEIERLKKGSSPSSPNP